MTIIVNTQDYAKKGIEGIFVRLRKSVDTFFYNNTTDSTGSIMYRSENLDIIRPGDVLYITATDSKGIYGA